MKQTKIKRKILGKKSKEKGKVAENIFSDMCEAQGLLFFRIEDGGFLAKDKQGNKIFIRRKQLCDFILFIDSEPYFIDVKNWALSEFIISNFFMSEKRKRPTSTHKQTNNFEKIYIRGYNKSGFIFIHNPCDFTFLSTKSLLKQKEENKKSITGVLCQKIKEIKLFV